MNFTQSDSGPYTDFQHVTFLLGKDYHAHRKQSAECDDLEKNKQTTENISDTHLPISLTSVLACDWPLDRQATWLSFSSASILDPSPPPSSRGCDEGGVCSSIFRGARGATYFVGLKLVRGKRTILWDLTHRPFMYWNLFKLIT